MSRHKPPVMSETNHSDSDTSNAFVGVRNPGGPAPVILTCDHASNSMPAGFTRPLSDEGLFNEHIAWDPGAMALATELSARIDAPLVYSKVSRLIYDCNRPPESDSAIPVKSELHDIPGNRNLDDSERQRRIDQIYTPFHATIERLIALKKSAGAEPAMVTVHSFTPIYFNRVRNTEIGILHDADSRMADLMLAVACSVCHLRVERNQPYGPQDGVTHTLIKHGLYHSLPNVMLEIRNDLLNGTQETRKMADIIEKMLTHSLSSLRQAA